tara:strand:+ start:903 stop:1121 length:219 start_codon:yes stop_codon:yes gene_type:complete
MPTSFIDIPVQWRISQAKIRTVATFTWTEREKMFEFINHMNSLGIGHFYQGNTISKEWDEEALIQKLMEFRP